MGEIHEKQSELAGKKLRIKEHAHVLGGKEILIEDWWDRVGGGSWMFADGNPACLCFAARSGFSKVKIPMNDEVLYGKIGGLGHLVHITELEVKDNGEDSNHDRRREGECQ